MKRTGLHLQDFSTQDILSLMDIYLSEWCHRQDDFFKLVFRYFYVDVLVLFLPNISSYMGIDLPKIPAVIFPCVSAALSLLFMYATIGDHKRIEASAKTYQKLIDLLPENLRRASIFSAEIKHGKFFPGYMNLTVSCGMFISAFLLSIVMIVYHLITV